VNVLAGLDEVRLARMKLVASGLSIFTEMSCTVNTFHFINNSSMTTGVFAWMLCRWQGKRIKINRVEPPES
jgi:hypothetical protein